jgi:hypothetical protein
MLNPSLADATQDDPTVRKCIGYAKRWGYNRIDIVNLSTFRSPSPSKLVVAGFPNGERADEKLQEVIYSTDVKRFVVAWGTWGGRMQDRIAFVLAAAKRAALPAECLTENQDGSPAHPLYLSYKLEPKPWKGPSDPWPGSNIHDT